MTVVHRLVPVLAVVALAAMPPCGLAGGGRESTIGILVGSGPLGPRPGLGEHELFGRFRTYDVAGRASGHQGCLQLRSAIYSPEYDVLDRVGRRTGFIDYFASRFTLYDAQRRVVGYFDGFTTLGGQYRILDEIWREIGALVPEARDGRVFRVVGDQPAAAVFARMGIALGPSRPRPRGPARIVRFERLHGTR